MSALLRLRLRDKLRLLWINAVCINQLDNDEKTRQVMLMRNIYEHALRMLVWLSEGSEESSLGLTMIPKLMEVQTHRPDLEARLLANLDQWDGAGLLGADESH
jgi:Heterokaryon incompatibility protein (HET)